MKIVFDIASPKQVRFFKPMMDRLRRRGCSVSAVTRAWNEVALLRRRLGVKATELGRHSDGKLLDKLVSSAERVQLLATHFHRLKPDALVTLSNCESMRAAFGLAIPIVCFLDLPESEKVGRLSLPLATRVCAPWIIPPRDFYRFGVSPRQLFRYRSLDPLVWLANAEVDASHLQDLGIDRDKVLVVARETEWQSTYVGSDVVNDVVSKLAARHPDWQIVNVPRYRTHRFYDMPSLFAHADLFLGGGGTMCIEAAYYGAPVIATRALECHYMRWLFDRRLAWPAATVPQAVRKAEEIVSKAATNGARQPRTAAAAALRRLDFPLDDVIDVILETARRR